MTDTNEAVGAEALEPVQAESTPQTETPQEAPTEAPEPETPEAESPEPSDEDKPKKKGGFQRQIEKVTREKYELELRYQQAQQELEEARRKATSLESKDPGEEPKIQNFPDIDSFLKAHKEWGIATGRKEGSDSARQELTQRQHQEEALRKQADLKVREDQVRVKHPDYDAVIHRTLPFLQTNDVLKEYVFEDAAGPEVAYHLGNNPALLMEIAKMPPIQAGRELFKLEERLKSPPPPKQTTKAPPPVKPVGSNEMAVKSYDDMSMEEYSRKRREERSKR